MARVRGEEEKEEEEESSDDVWSIEQYKQSDMQTVKWWRWHAWNKTERSAKRKIIARSKWVLKSNFRYLTLQVKAPYTFFDYGKTENLVDLHRTRTSENRKQTTQIEVHKRFSLSLFLLQD